MSSGNKYKVIANKIKFEGRAFINGNMSMLLMVKNLKQLILLQVKNFVMLLNAIIKMLI